MAAKAKAEPEAEPEVLGALYGPGERLVLWLRWEDDDHQVAVFPDGPDDTYDDDIEVRGYRTANRARARFVAVVSA